MRIRCRQNAPQRTIRVASKSYSFCFTFQWGFRLKRARAQPAQADQKDRSKVAGRDEIEAACTGQSSQVEQAWTYQVARPGAKARWGSLRKPIGQPARANRATRTRQSSQIDQPIEQPWPRVPLLASS